MRYHDIIDFENESRADREARLRVMYGVEDPDYMAQEAETELTLAKADSLRAERLAAVEKVEAEYEELARELEALLMARLSINPHIRSTDPALLHRGAGQGDVATATVAHQENPV